MDLLQQVYLSMHNNSIRKKILYQMPVLQIILSISVPMVTAPGLSNILFLLLVCQQINLYMQKMRFPVVEII